MAKLKDGYFKNIGSAEGNDSYALLAGGGHLGYSNSGGANALVQRDANGYIVNNYFYTSSGGAERNAGGLGYIAGFNASDYYIRSYTSAAVKTWLGLGSNAYTSTAYLPLTGGTLTSILTIQSGNDSKIILNNTDTETKYQQITFQQNGTEYGRLGTYGSDDLRWTNNTVLHAGNYSSYALPLSGGTMTGYLGFNSNYLQKPKADFRTTSDVYTGALTITLPAGIGNTMVSMWIDVYNYSTDTSFSVHVGGYTYDNSTWGNNPFAMVYGANHAVRLGHNGTSFVIYIGETNTTWHYPQVSVRDVITGYSQVYANWLNNFTISFATTFNSITASFTNKAWTSKNLTSVSQLSNDSGYFVSGNALSATTGSFSSHVRIGGGTANLGGLWDGGLIAGADGHDKIVATYLTSNTNAATIGAHNSGLWAWSKLNIAGTSIQFSINETPKMTLDSGGNLGLSGQFTSSGAIISNSAALGAGTPFAITQNRIQSYTSVWICADTDNSTGEGVFISASKGVSTNPNDGLAISNNTVNFLGNTVWHSGNLTGTQTGHTHNYADLANLVVAGNEHNWVPNGYSGDMWINYQDRVNRGSTALIGGYHLGNGRGGYANIRTSGYIINGYDNNYVVLAGGGAAAVNGLNVSSANYAYYFPTAYAGGQQLNPQTYFNQGIGLKVAMTAAAGVWSDTLWINGYAGGDVLSMCAIHTSRQGTPRMWISSQNSNGTSYGNLYEFVTTYNYSTLLDSRYRPMGGGWSGNGVPGTREFGWVTNDASGEVAFKSYNNTMNMIIDGNIYVTDNSYQVIHAGNIASQSVNYATSSGNATNSYYQVSTGVYNDWVASFQNTPAHATSFREMSAGGPSGTWWFMQNFRHSNGNSYWGRQIAWGWEDNAHEMYSRNITANSFSGWVRFLNSSNYNSFSPTLTGGNASGTWGINISGNSATATTATTANAASRTSGISGYAHAGTGMYAFYNWGGSDGGASAPNDSTYTIGISVGSHPGDQSYGFQIGRNMWNTGLWTRGYDSGWGTWYRILDSGNYSSYSPTLTGGGASGTWGINISGNSETATRIAASVSGTNTIELVRGNMADNDFFRILVGGTASNSGYAEIATADDGTEPIYVRQYLGVFTSLVRTATLLNEAGNTIFPGSVTGSRFYAGYDSGVANSISCSAWFRSSNATGWYNETYNGGIYMEDINYVRVYANKAFKVSSTASDSINTDGGILAGGSISSNNRIFTGYDSGQANSISCSNWFRSESTTGWYNATYGGGIWMNGNTYVEVYGNKAFKVTSTASDSINTDGGISASSIVNAPSFRCSTNNLMTTVGGNLAFQTSGGGITIGSGLSMYINGSAALGGGTPTSWYWQAGSFTSWADFYMGSLTANGTISASSTITTASYVSSAQGYYKSGSSNDYVLLGGGSHKSISDFRLKSEKVLKMVFRGYFAWSGTNSSPTSSNVVYSDFCTSYVISRVSTGRYRITFTGLKTTSSISADTTLQIFGAGRNINSDGTPCYISILNVSSNYFDIIASDDASLNDTTAFTLYINQMI